MDVPNVMGGALFVGLNLLVVLLPTLVALWLGVRAVRALERSARAQEHATQRLIELVGLASDTSRAFQDGERRSGKV